MRLDGDRGWVCEPCVPPAATDPSVVTERPPYRSARHALEMLIEIRSAGMASSLGRDIDRNAVGQVQSSRKDYLRREHCALGDLVPVWDELDEETRLVLELSVEVADWKNTARRCTDPKCAHVYGPIGYRCGYCNLSFGVDDPCCPKCGRFHTAHVLWPKQKSDEGVDLPNGKEACPRCNKRTEGEKVADKARIMAREVSAYRRAKFIRDHGREPFQKGDDDGDFDEELKVGYCSACGGWVRENEIVHSGNKWLTPCCRQRVRFPIPVTWKQIPGITGGAMHRWGRALKEKGLIA